MKSLIVRKVNAVGKGDLLITILIEQLILKGRKFTQISLNFCIFIVLVVFIYGLLDQLFGPFPWFVFKLKLDISIVIGLNRFLFFFNDCFCHFLNVRAINCIEWVSLDDIDDFITFFLFSDSTLFLIDFQNSFSSGNINVHVVNNLFNVFTLLDHSFN